jgi:hypothetical protein
MQIVVIRVDAHRYSTVVERDDVELRVPGYAFMRALPHDLAHFVVENTLRLDRGFWGSVAAGADFPGMGRLGGRRKPHATATAKTISKANTEYLSEAERLVACFEKIVDGKLDRVSQQADAELRQALAAVRHRSKGDHPIRDRECLRRVASHAGTLGRASDLRGHSSRMACSPLRAKCASDESSEAEAMRLAF